MGALDGVRVVDFGQWIAGPLAAMLLAIKAPWRLPTCGMVLSIVRSPFYAGAYAFGRRESRTRVVDGRATRTSGHDKPMARWMSLIRDHHPGYILWEQFERRFKPRKQPPPVRSRPGAA